MDHSAVNNFLSLSIWCTGLNIHYIFIQVQCTCLYHFKTVTIPTKNFASLGKTNIFLILIKIQLYFKHSTSRKYTSIIWKSSKMCSTLCMKYIWIFFVVFYVMTKTYNFNLYISNEVTNSKCIYEQTFHLSIAVPKWIPCFPLIIL